MVDLLGQLEHSYKTRLGYWKGGTVSVFGYGGGIIPRFSEVASMFPESKEFHTLRVQPPAGNHYTTKLLRQLSGSWSKWGSGLIAFHGQTGNIMFIGATTENTQHFFDEINEYGFDLGGAGPCVRTAMSCVGAARCEQSCANEHRIHRTLVNNFIDDMHRPALPYKFKFKVSGCPNDCMNSIQRAPGRSAHGQGQRDDRAERIAHEDVPVQVGDLALQEVGVALDVLDRLGQPHGAQRTVPQRTEGLQIPRRPGEARDRDDGWLLLAHGVLLWLRAAGRRLHTNLRHAGPPGL
jgi:hypothetical protein